MWIVITGNPVDGHNYYGPFGTSEEAARWGENNGEGGDWWIVELERSST